MYNKLNTKVNSFENKTPEATFPIHINQYNTDEQNLEKKYVMCWLKKYLKLVV